MEFFVLGAVEVSLAGTKVCLGGAKERTALASLLLYDDHVLSKQKLTQLLWDDAPPATAIAQIHTYMSRLRIKLSPHAEIVHEQPGYRLQMRDTWVDFKQFESLTWLGHGALTERRPAQAAEQFADALELWRGPAVNDATPYLIEQVGPVWEELHMSALEGRIVADLHLGRHTRLVPELTALVRQHPYRESLRVHLMKALYFCNRRTDALVVYQDGRRILVEEVGVDPGEELARTHMAVLQGRPRPHLLQLASP